MTTLDAIWSVSMDHDKIYVKWMKKVWKVKQKTPYGFILADAHGMKAYITLNAKEKKWSVATVEEFNESKLKGEK